MKIFVFLIIFSSVLACNAQKRQTAACKIWHPESFCKIPEDIEVAGFMYGEQLTIRYVPCEKLNNKNYVGIILTIQRKCGKKINFEPGFKNIRITSKRKGTDFYPKALLWKRRDHETKQVEYNYISDDFTAKKFFIKFNFQRKIDLILIFPEAESGDQIVIDNYLKLEVP